MMHICLKNNCANKASYKIKPLNPKGLDNTILDHIEVHNVNHGRLIVTANMRL